MGYLIAHDYHNYIQDRYFPQLIQARDSKRLATEAEVLAIIKGKLQQRFDVSGEFTNTEIYDPTKIYGARDRIYLDAAQWVTGTFAVGDLTLFTGIVYICTTANTDATFTIGHWNALGAQYDIFFVSYPAICKNHPTLSDQNAPAFNLYNNYNKGDVVWWKGNTYTCNTATSAITPSNLKQFFTYDNIPFTNIFPDDAINNNLGQFWNNKTSYTIAAGLIGADVYNPTTSYMAGNYVTFNGNIYKCTGDTTGIFDPTKWAQQWTKGDNRDQQITQAMKAIVIYNLSPLIATGNAPAEWEDRCKMAMQMLKDAAEGNIAMDLPQIEPKSGMMTSYGGRIKMKNYF